MSNLTIRPGKASFDDLAGDMKENILAVGERSFVKEGKFQLPFYSAFHIENGRVARPLQPIMKETSSQQLPMVVLRYV
jgi:predicted Zn-dependent protease